MAHRSLMSYNAGLDPANYYIKNLLIKKKGPGGPKLSSPPSTPRRGADPQKARSAAQLLPGIIWRPLPEHAAHRAHLRRRSPCGAGTGVKAARAPSALCRLHPRVSRLGFFAVSSRPCDAWRFFCSRGPCWPRWASSGGSETEEMRCHMTRQAACGRRYIPVAWLCSRERECPDGADEQCGAATHMNCSPPSNSCSFFMDPFSSLPATSALGISP
ncbi:uncharacterized protein LOC129644386 [Bubalus kerabau]|uniref:uncharacterized protein LOC129644386 n=1 Tax=Bubalus carabanensis TaxID=3119969 RepID=UPI00244EA324|nr:uncharacterized protein LOC129644386 [Bubalus carabanensis]